MSYMEIMITEAGYSHRSYPLNMLNTFQTISLRFKFREKREIEL